MLVVLFNLVRTLGLVDIIGFVSFKSKLTFCISVLVILTFITNQ